MLLRNDITRGVVYAGRFIKHTKRILRIRRKFHITFFSIYMRKKLQFFTFYLDNRYCSYSTGQLLKINIKSLKFLKRSHSSINLSLNSLKKKLKDGLNKIFFFFCKNFNFRNYLWVKNLFYSVKPTIFFFFVTHGYPYISKKKKRIKKKILKNIISNSLL